MRNCLPAQGASQVLLDVRWEPTPGSSTQCKHPKKLDRKLRPPLEPERFDYVVDAPVALQALVLMLRHLREAYFEDIRSPADPGLWAHGSSKLP